MSKLGVTLDILNQKGTPAFYSDIFTNRPAAGFAGRVFISTDTGAIYEDTGSTWTLIADATGPVTGGTLQSVTTSGNTTNNGIVISANGLSSNSITNTSLTAGSVTFVGTAGLMTQDNTNLFWDNTSKYFGIGPTGGPTAPLDIHNATANVFMQLNATGTNNSNIAFLNGGVGKWRVGNLYNAGANSFQVYDVLNATARLTILNNGATTLNGALSVNSITAPSILGVTNISFVTESSDAASISTTISGVNTYLDFNLQDDILQDEWRWRFTPTSGITYDAMRLVATTSTTSNLIVSGTINGSNLSGTNTGDVTIGTANGLSLSSQALSLALASTSTTGALSSTDWTTFNNKQGAITLTTTGTSGAATLIANTLNIPQYSGGGGMAIGGSITSATAGSVLYAGASGVLAQSNTNFYYDYTNIRLGIGTSSPSRKFVVQGGSTDAGMLVSSTAGTKLLQISGRGSSGVSLNQGFLEMTDQGTNKIQLDCAGKSYFTGGNFLIGSSTDTSQGVLQVTGGITANDISLTGATYSASATITTNYYSLFTGSTGQTLTLPSPSSNNYQYVFINTTANAVTIAAATSTNIVNLAGTSVASITLIANGRTFIIADGNNKYYQVF